MSIATDEIETLDEAAIARLEGRYEYLNGRYVEKPPMGARANGLAFILLAEIWLHARANRLGVCFGDSTDYRIFANEPKRTRIPDGSFIRSGRLPNNKAPEGILTIPPDLAIEVVSPNDSAVNVNERIVDLLGAGVRLLWVIYPKTRQVYVHRADGSLSLLNADDELTGEDVIPGFTLRLADLFDAI